MELVYGGFKVKFFDLMKGNERVCYYADRASFDAEWELFEEVGDIEYKRYMIIDYYEE